MPRCAFVRGEGDVVRQRELIAPVEECLGVGVILAVRDLVKTVCKNMGNVEVARMKAADEALQERIAAKRVFARVDQTHTVIDVKAHRMAFFDTDHTAGLVFQSLVDGVNESFGFAGAFRPHDDVNHRVLLLCSVQGIFQCILALFFKKHNSIFRFSQKMTLYSAFSGRPSSSAAARRVGSSCGRSNGSTPQAQAKMAFASSKK